MNAENDGPVRRAPGFPPTKQPAAPSADQALQGESRAQGHELMSRVRRLLGRQRKFHAGIMRHRCLWVVGP